MLSLLTVTIVLVFGCAKENVVSAKPVQVSLKENGDCLTTFGENITKFQKGELSNEQVKDFWTCVQKAVGDYQRLTSGDQVGGAYTPQALRRFLTKYFIKSDTINDALLESLMEIKRVLLAGNTREISRRELDSLQELLEMFKEVSVLMNPHVKVIFMDAPTASDEEIRLAGAVVQQSLLRLGGWLERNRQNYSFGQMSSLVRNLQDFRKQDAQTSDLFKMLNQAIEVLPSAKQILLNGPETEIRGTEWLNLTASLGEGYRSLLAVQYAFEDDLNTALTRAAVPHGMEFAVSILERGANARAKKEIPLSEWQTLFDRLEKVGWIDGSFKSENLMYAFRWVLDRTLARGKGPKATALTMTHLKSLRSLLVEWQMLRKAVLGNGPYRGTVGESFKKMIAASRPQEWDTRGRMSFPIQPAVTWSVDGQLHMVWPFVVMNWLKNAFVDDDVNELGDEQMGAAGLEILTTLRKFGWLLETKDNIGKKLLRESDLFTLASNGNGSIDLNEATRYLAFIASSFRAAQIWLAEADLVCGGRQVECTRRLGGDLSRDILASLPRLQNWLRQKNSVPRFVSYMTSGEETILEKITVGEFGVADVLQVWMLFQYVETFLQRYDGNFSDTVSLPEATPAFDVYGPILGKMLSRVGLPPAELFGFFTFLMKYGDTPFTMFGGQVLYNHWKWHQKDWAFESERTHLMGILNQLSKL